MRKFLLFLTITILFSCPLLNFAKESFAVEEEAGIRKIYRDMYQYMISKDIYQLGRLLDDSFVLTHMTGMKYDGYETVKARIS